ncbi:MAG: D-alanine--D-alanine ligase [Gammaproteobacteria bacterium]|nr:D-alanine--D-alanine ligase [Gammaproteobacteria bacterium]
MTADFGKVGVLMGGPSAEREVSLSSGRAVLSALLNAGVDAVGVDADSAVLDRLKELAVDRVFIALHGRWGEDGVIQGALEVVGIPYTGSGVLGSALAMDKLRSKKLWMAAGIPTPEFVETRDEHVLETIREAIGFPVFVKPNREGSSLGVTRVETEADLKDAWSHARALDDELFAERCIDGAELTIGILADDTLPAIRLETPRTFYDYHAKYVADDTRYHCPSGLDPELEAQLKVQARRAFQVLGCEGWGRVDLMLDQKRVPYFLEVNTVPGMTDHSLVPMAARAAGIDFQELVQRILEASL